MPGGDAVTSYSNKNLYSCIPSARGSLGHMSLLVLPFVIVPAVTWLRRPTVGRTCCQLGPTDGSRLFDGCHAPDRLCRVDLEFQSVQKKPDADERRTRALDPSKSDGSENSEQHGR